MFYIGKEWIRDYRKNLLEYTNLTQKEYNIGKNLSNKKYTVDLNGYREHNDFDYGLSNAEIIPSTDITMEDDILTKIVLNEFLQKLNEDEQTIFVEKYLQEKNNNYISKKSNISYSKIKRIDEKLIKKILKELQIEN
ncbi:sigma-70 family RNA polymerase sigma factor [Peptoniphilus timonensis]|uniref:sigma-70 family RNA polymerase sigma factor n=1 Tax=Peptoniphilus timonensis TaxID=1268254 RepID=UPI0003102BE2|nr:sigma-70 family RNA polymerase sigma factor [Peptoniphilus timonensis]